MIKGDKYLLVPNDHMVEVTEVVFDGDVIKGFETILKTADNRVIEKFLPVEEYHDIKTQLFKLP